MLLKVIPSQCCTYIQQRTSCGECACKYLMQIPACLVIRDKVTCGALSSKTADDDLPANSNTAVSSGVLFVQMEAGQVQGIKP